MAVHPPTLLVHAQPIEIRPCTSNDADALSQIGAATFLETYAGLLPGRDVLLHCRRHHTPEAYRALLQEPLTRAWIVETGSAPVGYAMITKPDLPPDLWSGEDMELKRLYLFSRVHGRGLARKILEEIRNVLLETACPNLLVGLYEQNLRAYAFYRKTGFELVGRRTFTMGACVFNDPVLRLRLHP